MNWTVEIESRFTELRQKELSSTLTVTEKAELAELIAALEAKEARQLAPTLARMRAEQNDVQAEIQALQADNHELVHIIAQQEQLIIDARRWLAEFERRHQSIRQSYMQLTGKVPA